MVVLPLCRAGGGCVVVLECGCRVVVVVVEPIIGCHVVESDDVAPGSVVNNKVRGGNGDLLTIETTNDDYPKKKRTTESKIPSPIPSNLVGCKSQQLMTSFSPPIYSVFLNQRLLVYFLATHIISCSPNF